MKKKKEEEKKYQEEKEKQEKKERQEVQKRKDSESSLPRGKQRRSIFSPKKKAQLQHAEYKPAGGQG